MDARHAVAAARAPVGVGDLLGELRVPHRAGRGSGGAAVVVGGSGDLEQFTGAFDAVARGLPDAVNAGLVCVEAAGTRRIYRLAPALASEA